MQNSAIKTSLNFSTEKAAKSILSLIKKNFEIHQLKSPKNLRIDEK